MTFKPLDHPPTSQSTPASSASSPELSPAGLFLSDVPDQPLTWLWPGRLAPGHLTLLDAAPGTDPSLLALTLAACLSSGTPLPDGTPTQPASVILYTPYDSASASLKPRLVAAGADLDRLLLYHPQTAARTRFLSLPDDLEHLSILIRFLEARLLILDPASAIPGLSRHLPALVELAQQTSCAILLIRSLNKPPANPLHPSGPPSPLQEAARCRLLLTSDPSNEQQHLLIPTRHPLSPQPPGILAYDILFSEAGIPTLHWLGQRDRTHLARLSTGPLHSPHRQAILRFLQHSDTPRSISDILAATCYDSEAGRQMLVRMKQAGELVSPARGLYTTANHPCLASFPTDSAPVSDIRTALDQLCADLGMECFFADDPRLDSSVTYVTNTLERPSPPQSIDMEAILSSSSPSPSASYILPRCKTPTAPTAASAASPSRVPLL